MWNGRRWKCFPWKLLHSVSCVTSALHILILQYLVTLERNQRNQKIKILSLPLLEKNLHPALQNIRPQLRKPNSNFFIFNTKTLFKFSSISKVTSLEKAVMKNGHTQIGVCQHRQIRRLNEEFHSFSDNRNHIIHEI